jgi:glyoxylase-like metal-dependent hydrolase (beta-lactamase superfamily II)
VSRSLTETVRRSSRFRHNRVTRTGGRLTDDERMQLPVTSPWFARRRIDDSITVLWEPHVHRILRCNIWHVRGRKRDLIVDTGLGIASLTGAAADLFGHAPLAVATNRHCDHTGGLHEFENRAIHRADARAVGSAAGIGGALVVAGIPAETRLALTRAGYELDGELLLDAAPWAGYDVAAYAVKPPEPTMVLDEGDLIDLGDRAFEVLHLPGATPGTIGLWDVDSGILFSGDAVTEGPVLDEVPGADLDAYLTTMELLHDLPVEVVHAGHDASFGRDRLRELTGAYLQRRRPSLV